jgi:SAM-dependent methyltransferase
MSKLIVTKLNEKLERINCAYCGSFDYRILFSGKDRIQNKRGEYPVVQCKRCGLIYLNPRPSTDYLKNYYYDDYFGHEPLITFEERQNTRKKRVFRFLRNKTLAAHFRYHHLTKSNSFWKVFTTPLVDYFRLQLMPTYQNNGRLLEVGCSYGWRLERLRDLGWDDVMGVELGVGAVEIARSKGLNVICLPVEKVNFKDNVFDVIIASMVMEHTSDPFFVFEKFERWLKPGGQLLFSIPNIGGLEYRIFKKYWYPLQIPYHLYYFSDKFIKKILTNFDVTVRYQKAERDIIASLRYFVDENRKYNCLSVFLKLPRKTYKMIEDILSRMKRTSRISVYAIKK